MATHTRHVRFDEELQIEAYQFIGLAQKFPNHFHDYYVIGLIETGERNLTVNHHTYPIGPGDMMTFNPMDNHACEQTDNGSLNYRALNIKPDVMQYITQTILETDTLPYFHLPLLYRTELAPTFQTLHENIMNGITGLEKEELFWLCMQYIITTHTRPISGKTEPASRKEVEAICAYLNTHYTERITLEQLGNLVGLNKYTLLRTFTHSKCITPYRYLETLRINKAKELLKLGIEPAEAAQQTGFSDQSHFTNYFNKFIGLTPKQYQSIFRSNLK